MAPVELLGLTATPERADSLSLLGRFDGRIAAELRLWDAIDQHRLSPFAYYGIHDGLDLREVPWRRPTGYDVEGLTNLYTASDAWARQAVLEVHSGVDDVRTMRALGFCVSVDHARFMARVFNEAGIAALAVWADSPADERQAALRDLADGRVQVVFSVDLFNEGVDVPVVDTLLFLRPTDSWGCAVNSSAGDCTGRQASRCARCSTSWATAARSSGSTAASGRCSAAPARTSSGRSRTASRSCPLAATWNSTPWRSPAVTGAGR